MKKFYEKPIVTFMQLRPEERTAICDSGTLNAQGQPQAQCQKNNSGNNGKSPSNFS